MSSNSPTKTRFLILSDTHNISLPPEYISNHDADVVIHCGDLTQSSMLDELQASINFLQQIDAPLKLVIPGNHDFTLDTPFFRSMVEKDTAHLRPEAIAKAYGSYGEAKQLFMSPDAKAGGVRLLDEGTHHFTLRNGASLTVYASPYTPSLWNSGFQYKRSEGHHFEIQQNVDVAVTHGPPRGVMDLTASGQQAGCLELLAAVAHARPRMHCFGHIHEGWGAKLVTWEEKVGECSSPSVGINEDRSVVIASLSTLPSQGQGFYRTSHCERDEYPLVAGSQTLFVNAATVGLDEASVQPPWLVELELPLAKSLI
ncbi:metallophosphatase domain-containing protein [Aspergillus saccharolyticus JOP 1030-1]|uniref:Putative metallophosphoesterase domain-containing protein n=1 Tax=Aspergillus saccharolyticus JOP 1030-1 TaxID=1450539 RepID=A0A319A5B7_9EURO|nr:putative metallophosphoesterase domain-containing protein [Aspergillus saccharolyticus JOP 1030-1]PYH42612.1 putative metallophosphoesterase domain-containing protein [Aspergillus saccharolyticus JOP 1030-1]